MYLHIRNQHYLSTLSTALSNTSTNKYICITGHANNDLGEKGKMLHRHENFFALTPRAPCAPRHGYNHCLSCTGTHFRRVERRGYRQPAYPDDDIGREAGGGFPIGAHGALGVSAKKFSAVSYSAF